MNVLWIYAHPEARSLNGALRSAGLETLAELGHEVRESDLYAMDWKPTVDSDDYTEQVAEERLRIGPASKHAYQTETLSSDIRAEIEKLEWADAVVFQFPLWWFGMPAIMKGWIDRVFVKGFAYGVQDPEHPGHNLRYGDGRLRGKRGLAVVTIGAAEETFGPRGISGQLDQVLFPLLHGTFWYTGMDPMPPLGIHGAEHVSAQQYADAAASLRKRLVGLATDVPIDYRPETGGDYDDNLVLRDEHAPGESGLGVHALT
ncbi:NAD(P)H-dependent oxidoreductase [Nocardioidaceae bacterium SCSIO 66511]|nr:NAD(P)H-dependent oxidoreductase [Nocardioidaceae bacterium SCSIO 66511]